MALCSLGITGHGKEVGGSRILDVTLLSCFALLLFYFALLLLKFEGSNQVIPNVHSVCLKLISFLG